MKINFSKWFAGLFIIALFIGLGTVLPVAADEMEERVSSDPNKIQGFIDSIGKDFIIVNGKRFHLSPKVLFFDEEGGKVVNGEKILKPEMRVDLTLNKDKIVEATIYGLLMR